MNSSKSKELVLVGPDSSPRGTGPVLVHRGMQKAAPALSCPPLHPQHSWSEVAAPEAGPACVHGARTTGPCT